MPRSFKSAMLYKMLREENGNLTLSGFYFMLIALAVGGLAIDMSHLSAERTRLQTAADSMAHAAMLMRDTENAETAIQRAFEIGSTVLPIDTHGEAIRIEDIEFGIWDSDSDNFVPDPNARDAVRVSVGKDASRANSINTYLLRLVGIEDMDYTTQTVFISEIPACMREGIAANGTVTLKGNNTFSPGFCTHSNASVSLQNNNVFLPGAVLSMPDPSEVSVPNDDPSSNPGLKEALRSSIYKIRSVARIPKIIDSLYAASPKYMPDYIYGMGILPLTGAKLTPESFTAGRIHSLDCVGNGSVMFEAGVYSELVFLTNCQVKFQQGVMLEDVIVATTNASDHSVTAPSGLRIGRDDDCASDGGAIVMTLGDFTAAANLELFGGQIMAAGDINFAARAYGIEGASLVAGGSISGTSNTEMDSCGVTGMEHVITSVKFRMAY